MVNDPWQVQPCMLSAFTFCREAGYFVDVGSSLAYLRATCTSVAELIAICCICLKDWLSACGSGRLAGRHALMMATLSGERAKCGRR